MNRIAQLLVVGLLLIPVSFRAQGTERLSVATLNVDGLPQKILVFNVNAEGPGAEGTARIGKYLQKKAFDIVCMQEDFNYHGVLTPWLEDDYKFDEWTGSVGIDVPGKKIDLLHAQNEQFECDGLGACWKNNIVETATERVPWVKSFGKFSHAADELVKKGYRRSELTLASGTRIIVYNMHMDAGDLADEKEGKDTKDREARLAEWQQLREDVLIHLDTRPILIMGDLNSYYSRDQIKAEFIDKINDTGRGHVEDVWVKLGRDGQYPAVKEGPVYCEADDNIMDGEALDKILYINPSNGAQLVPVSYSIDTEGYKYDGKPLGDHYPLSAVFEIKNGSKSAANIETVPATAQEPAEYFNLGGQRVDMPANGLYIERRGHESHKRIVK